MIGSKRVFVIGHRNPDSDSVCAAIAYAYFKNSMDKQHLYIPARAGALLKETQFILDYFKIETPILVTNLSSTVSDLNLKTPITAFLHQSIKDVAMIMKERNIDTVPIVDEYQRLLGVTGYKDIAKYYIDRIKWDEVTTSVSVDLKTLVQTLQARILANPKKVKTLTGRILIAAMQKGTILHYIKKGDIAIVGDRTDIQADLIKSGCKALILTDETSVSEEIIKLAKKHSTLLLSTPYSSFTVSNLLPLAVPVKAAMRQDVPVVFLETPIGEVKKKVLESVYRCALVVDSERRLISIITRSDLIYSIKKKVILVDHNEKSQAVTGVEEAEILEIIDHHRLGDISTLKPIFVYNDPVGSTCTI
ncbi:MAG TPA: putative manganese-dependent inorganic diphosphatase, partial [Candidatus Desulfofervidus auxilii]|nr:putative manganese-dependent inorganic diphosphatase [Candidatus Desulfofervidus auxilii]